MKKYRIALLDDYQNVALESADWSVLRDRADDKTFYDDTASNIRKWLDTQLASFHTYF
jgi:hypothetical protein